MSKDCKSWRRKPSKKQDAFDYLNVDSSDYAYLGHFRQDRFLQEGHNVSKPGKAKKPKLPNTVPRPGNERPAWGKDPAQQPRPLKPTASNPDRRVPGKGGKKKPKPVEPVAPVLPAPAPVTINFPTAAAPNETVNIYEAPNYEGPTAADNTRERQAAEAHDKQMTEAAALRARNEEAMGRNRTRLQQGLDDTFVPGRSVNDLVR